MMKLIWLALLVFFLFLEGSSVSLVSVWFAGGALAAMIASLLGAEIWLQAVIFLGVSGLLLALLRPILKKYITPKITNTNVDALIHSAGLVTVRIDNVTAAGQVKLGAMEWSARSTSGAPIEVGTQVTVDRIEGVKVFVSPAEVPAGVK